MVSWAETGKLGRRQGHHECRFGNVDIGLLVNMAVGTDFEGRLGLEVCIGNLRLVQAMRINSLLRRH